MNDRVESSRRELLGKSLGIVAASGLAAAAGCSSLRTPVSGVPVGPAPRPIAPDAKIRFGLVGVGGRGGALLRAILKQKNVEIKAVADPDEPHREKALELIESTGAATPEEYKDEDGYKRLIAREDIDAVAIATPCHLHARMYLTCFAAGRHFYGEKPMCITAVDADLLVEAQKRNPRVIAQIGFQRRASECYQEGIRKLHEGLIGPAISVRAAWNNAWGPLGGTGSGGTSFWFGRREFSGDWMLEQACHSWDVMGWIAGGMPVAAYGVGRKDIFTDVDPGRDVTDFYLATIEYPNGMLVDFEHAWFYPNKAEAVFTGNFERVACPKGGIDLTGGKIYPRDPKGQIIDLPPPKGSGDLTIQHMGAFVNSLRTGSPPISGVVNGRMATYTGLLVRKAVDEHRRVLMSEIG